MTTKRCRIYLPDPHHEDWGLQWVLRTFRKIGYWTCISSPFWIIKNLVYEYRLKQLASEFRILENEIGKIAGFGGNWFNEIHDLSNPSFTIYGCQDVERNHLLLRRLKDRAKEIAPHRAWRITVTMVNG